MVGILDDALGAARLALESNEEPRRLREAVTSRGGTTEAAFRRFARRRLGEALRAGIRAAAARAKELGI